MIFDLHFYQNDLFFGALDFPTRGIQISGPFEVKGWICGRGEPAQVRATSLNGVLRGGHHTRPDVYTHVQRLRESLGQEFFVYGFRFFLSETDSFELVVRNSRGSFSWIRAQDKTAELDAGLAEAAKFFGSLDFISRLRWEPELGSYFDVEEKKQYLLLGSYQEEDLNFLIVWDAKYRTHHILCQRVLAAELIYQVESHKFQRLNAGFSHVDGKMFEVAEKLSLEIARLGKNVPKVNQTKSLFCVGKLSLNHYFYDTLPGLMWTSMNLHHSVSRELLTNGREFLPTTSMLEGRWSTSGLASEQKSELDWSRRPLILAGINWNQIDVRLREKLDKAIVLLAGGCDVSEFESPSPVIWFDLATKNRTWNMQETLEALIPELLKVFDRPIFIFDNQTATFDSRAVPNQIPEWIKDIPSIERADLICLDGAKADAKIRWAFRTDFFFASATTGSMFLSRFASAPGIAMSAPRTFQSAENLFGTWRKIQIPPGHFLEEDQDSPSPWADFRLNVQEFVPWALEQVERCVQPL